MQVHYKNFGSKTALRCGFVRGKYDYPSHIHQFPEIVYVKEGSLEITVDDTTETMSAGDIAIIPPFCVHSFFTPKFTNRWICVFSGDFVSTFITDEEFFGSGETTVFHASGGLTSFIEQHLLDTEETFVELTAESVRSFKAIIFSIYEEYLRTVKRKNKKKHREALSSILYYISQHYTENISLSSIGQALSYSPKYVSLCLADVEEMNLNYLVNSFRADHAKLMLINTKLKMIDVALECGYTNERSFYRSFLQTTGMTPGEYRKSKRTNSTQENEPLPYPELYKSRAEAKNEKRAATKKNG